MVVPAPVRRAELVAWRWRGALAGTGLAHAVGSQVEQYYARSDALERRRAVMEALGKEH